MKPQADIRIVPATEEDFEIIGDFFKKYFYAEEPLNNSLKRNPPLEEMPFKAILGSNMSFKAVDVLDQTGDNLAGVVLNEEATFGSRKKPPRSMCPKFLKIRKILTELDEKSGIWDKVNNETHMDVIALAVNTKYRGLKIGQKLLEHSLNLARSRNYKYASVTCTSFYSARIALEMGFELIYEMPYNEYLNEDGEPIFKVKPPHVAIKKLVKVL